MRGGVGRNERKKYGTIDKGRRHNRRKTYIDYVCFVKNKNKCCIKVKEQIHFIKFLYC